MMRFKNLFYWVQGWKDSTPLLLILISSHECRDFKAVDAEYGWAKELARIVPDIRDVDERSRNRMKYKLY